MSFGSATTAMDVVEGRDLDGTIAIVTGATGGIGLETARALLAAGAQVFLGNRIGDRSDRALSELRAEHGASRVDAIPLDLASLDSVRAFADDILGRSDRVDLLINNAGVMATPFAHTTDGFELQIGVNHLGHFLLTSLLLPRLLDSNPARIITLSSSAHFMGGVDLDDLNYEARPYAPWPAYGQSKTANILFTLELRRRYAARNLLAFAVHPGYVDTDLFRHLGDEEVAGMDQQAATHDEPKKTPAQGAATTLFAATTDPAELADAPYLADCAPSRAVARHARDTDIAPRLWDLSEQLVGATCPT